MVNKIYTNGIAPVPRNLVPNRPGNYPESNMNDDQNGHRAEGEHDEEAERKHFKKVLAAFQAYKRDSMERLSRVKSNLKRIPLEQQQKLTQNGFLENVQALESCVELNYSIIEKIVADVAGMFENVEHAIDGDSEAEGNADGAEMPRTHPEDIDKVQSTLKSFVRDWSSEGEQEREKCYKPILDELANMYPKGRSTIKVLVPGAGMGRLAFEIARMGFECQGNEFSLFMLFASNFVLNKCRSTNCYKIYPWIHQISNNMSSDDVRRAASFPDVDPNVLPDDSKFSMAAGDFLEVYADPSYQGYHDVVVTCFFIDCAHNILDFIELIYKTLKPGGRWINLGPLLYHFADMPREMSLEPSYDMVKDLILKSGFKYEREELGMKATYCQNPMSMLQYEYRCVFFTCVK